MAMGSIAASLGILGRRIGALAAFALLAAVPAPGLAASSHSIAITATVLSGGNCKFNTNNSTLAFGNIDPSSNVNATASITLAFRCTGPAGAIITWGVASDDGQNELGAGAPRMRHATDTLEFLPYTLSFATSGSTPRNTDVNFPVNGTIVPADFQNARAGSYSDSVILSISP